MRPVQFRKVEETEWKPTNQVDSITLSHFLECIMEMSDALESLNKKDEIAKDGKGVILRATSRRVSVVLRKILLDGNVSLLKRCVVNPTMHPLKAPEKKTYIMTQEHREVSLVVGRKEKGERQYTIPSHRHVTKLNSLPGIEFHDEGNCTIRTPFDETKSPRKLTKWMTSGILQVDSTKYTIEQLLRIMANSEGAHLTPMVPLVTPAVPMEQIGNRREARYVMANTILFGVMTFPQILSMYTGMYLKNRVKQMMASAEIEEKVSEYDAIRKKLANSLDNIQLKATIMPNMHPMVLFGKDEELRGDYSQGITTTIQMP